MGTKISGGGGSSSPFASSRARMLKLTDTVIADGADIGIAFNRLIVDPDATTDYDLVPDNGNGTVGVRVNKDGFYIMEVIMGQLVPIGGTIQVFIDTASTFGKASLSGFTISPTQNVGTDGIDKIGTYYTAVSLGLEVFGVFIRNNSGASITLPGFSLQVALTRVAPSPTP